LFATAAVVVEFGDQMNDLTEPASTVATEAVEADKDGYELSPFKVVVTE
jgi:hypothetical protein